MRDMARLWRLQRPIILALAGLVGSLCSPGADKAYADGFTLTGKLGGKFEVDTNPLLHKKDAQTLFGWNSIPELILTGTGAATLPTGMAETAPGPRFVRSVAGSYGPQEGRQHLRHAERQRTDPIMCVASRVHTGKLASQRGSDLP